MRYVCGVLCFLFLNSCNLFQQNADEDIVARVGDEYLYRSDIEMLTANIVSKEDSIFHANNFINRWASQKLLMRLARRNLSQEKLAEYEKLIDNYRTDLFTIGYKDIIATNQLNDRIREEEYEAFYEQNKQNFLLNENLIQFRYIHVDEKNSNLNKIKQQLSRFKLEDKEELEKIGFQFNSSSLNDSIWLPAASISDRIPVLGTEINEQLLKKSNYIELRDSLGVYLIHIKDVILRNEIAPLEYLKPTLQTVILNKRKLEFINNLEKDIINDAIKNKDFEIYN
ncbi:MAG: peptidyl-prolyl cis-trans isomerase [Flavobacteriales bacterium]|jgi:hypothetical protein|nr:peptidyl-prolyl cis-trans isomerase [Flavobacteriales bacterium]